MKLMGHQNQTNGCLTNIKYYSFTEYNGNSDLVELDEFPIVDGPWVYSPTSKQAIAAISLLSLSVNPVNVTADGVDYTTTVISGPASAIVNVTFAGAVPIDAIQYTLDGSGNATVTFGPTTLRTTSPLTVCFDLDDGTSPRIAKLQLNLI